MRDITVAVELTGRDLEFLESVLKCVIDTNTEQEAETLTLLRSRLAHAQAELMSARAMALALNTQSYIKGDTL
jgi:hypothetical protein